jgi:hypothetical protein
MDKKIVVTLLFFIFSTGCGVTGMYVHDSKPEEDYSQDYRGCADEVRTIKNGTMQMRFFQGCMESRGWKFIDEKGNERKSGPHILSPKNKLSGPSRFHGF